MLKFSFLLACCFVLHVASGLQLSGKVLLPGKTSHDLPKGSCFIVELVDARVADWLPPKLIAKVVMDDPKIGKGNIMRYSMEFNRPTMADSLELSVSATLNKGWCEESKEGKKAFSSVRVGDCTSDTRFVVELKKDVEQYVKNFHLIHV